MKELLRNHYSPENPLVFHEFYNGDEYSYHAHFNLLYANPKYFGGDESGAVYIAPVKIIKDQLICQLWGRGWGKKYNGFQSLPVNCSEFFSDKGEKESAAVAMGIEKLGLTVKVGIMTYVGDDAYCNGKIVGKFLGEDDNFNTSYLVLKSPMKLMTTNGVVEEVKEFPAGSILSHDNYCNGDFFQEVSKDIMLYRIIGYPQRHHVDNIINILGTDKCDLSNALKMCYETPCMPQDGKIRQKWLRAEKLISE